MSSTTTVVRKRGYLLLKDSGIRSFIWSRKFLQLRDQMVTIHKNEQTYQALGIILLRDVEKVERNDLKEFAFSVITRDKSYNFACENDTELYSWIEEIYSRSPVGFSTPTNFSHNVHVGFDPISGKFEVRFINRDCLKLGKAFWKTLIFQKKIWPTTHKLSLIFLGSLPKIWPKRNQYLQPHLICY